MYTKIYSENFSAIVTLNCTIVTYSSPELTTDINLVVFQSYFKMYICAKDYHFQYHFLLLKK